jgi:hypothetical protein
MITLERDATISAKVESPYQSGMTASPTLSRAPDDRLRNRAAWQDVIDYKLVEWGQDPGRFVEEGLTPPSAMAIRGACVLAGILRDLDREAPQRVVPSGDGGIVFERRKGELFEKIEIQEDGSVEWAAFRNSRLQSRDRWDLNTRNARC